MEARIAKVAGGVGGVRAGLLQVAGHEITVCTRRPLNGLVVETAHGIVRVEASDLTGPAAADPSNRLFVSTKTCDVPGRKLGLERLCGPGTDVDVFKNGIEYGENFAP